MTSPYGRGPAELALADCREMTLMLERMLWFKRLMPGTTVWRDTRGDKPVWWVLPDPEEKPMRIEAGAITFWEFANSPWLQKKVRK